MNTETKKICTKCKQEKNLSEFSLQRKNVYRSRCNFCKNEDNKLYRLNNKEKDKQSKQNWKEKNPDYWLSYYNENKEDRKKYLSEYYEENKDKIIDKIIDNVKEYYNINKEEILLNRKNHYENNKDGILLKTKEYYINNKEKYKEYSIKSYHIKKIKFPHRFAWRSVLKNALKQMNTKKTDLTLNMLGYSANDLKLHMESLFTEGMNWNNWGEWHIHHKKFVSHFDFNTPSSVVNALDNLIPLWKEDHKKIHKK